MPLRDADGVGRPLVRLRARIPAAKADPVGRWSADGYVLPSRYGRPFASFPKQAWTSAIRRAGLAGRGLAPHSLRRTFATYFPGTDRDCQEILGHRDLKTTLIYRRSRDERKRTAVIGLDYGFEPRMSDACTPKAKAR